MALLPTGALTTVTPTALWTWDTTNPNDPIPQAYNGYPTKTGLLPDDLSLYCGVPLYYNGTPPVAMTSTQKLQAIRWAEDWVEQETGLLLTPTWIASPPTRNVQETANAGMSTSSGAQQLGVDYDLEDAPYDFFYDHTQDEGWFEISMRYRPIRNVNPLDLGPIKNMAYQYPLLNTIFRIPPTWMVVDQDYGILRLVPGQNLAMLPLWAMTLTLGGNAMSIPGALHFQYSAGLTPNDMRSRFSFIKQLVLAHASILCIRSIAGGIGLGADQYSTLIDGVQFSTRYGAQGPYGAQIAQFEKQRNELLQTAINKVMGPVMLTL